ncbi:MAG: hypothetical protein HXY34_13125 [Candidatus Thorarchaeota archaeon]|nr:hypothetical protein [Candidatus Thorarchaeota archaeon]
MRPLSQLSFSGILLIASYCSFTLVSWLAYPYPFSPLTNYLSRLGNFEYSPLGAYAYNIGCVVTGVLLLFFFADLQSLSLRTRAQRVLLAAGQLIGLCSAVALMMIGVFSEDQGAPHMLASSVFFELNFAVLLIVGLSCAAERGLLRYAGLYSIFVALSSVVLALSVGGPVIEWYTVFASLLFVAQVSYIVFRSAHSRPAPMIETAFPDK